MERPHMTVLTTNNIRYDANHLSIELVDGLDGRQVSFLCSGRRVTLDAASVKEIAFHPTGGAFCSECDRPY